MERSGQTKDEDEHSAAGFCRVPMGLVDQQQYMFCILMTVLCIVWFASCNHLHCANQTYVTCSLTNSLFCLCLSAGQEELAQLNPGETVSRTPAQPRPFFSFRRMDAPLRSRRADEPAQVTQEELSIDEDGNALLKRMDVWPYNLEEAWRSSSKPKE